MSIVHHVKVPGIFMLVVVAVIMAFGHGGVVLSASQQGVYTTGRLLVAVPEVIDPRFGKSVILMVKHDQKGAFGLIINSPLGDSPLKDLLIGFDMDTETELLADRSVQLLYGGPVERGALFIIHSNDYRSEYTNRINNLFSMAHTRQTLRDIAAGQGPKDILFALGYAGWGPGQLESEIDRGDWLIAPATHDLVFGGHEELKWKRATESAGLDL